MTHVWVWQRGFLFYHAIQVCLRPGCEWRRRRVEVGRQKGRKGVWRYSYRRGPGGSYRLLLRSPACEGASVGHSARERARAAASLGLEDDADLARTGGGQE